MKEELCNFSNMILNKYKIYNHSVFCLRCPRKLIRILQPEIYIMNISHNIFSKFLLPDISGIRDAAQRIIVTTVGSAIKVGRAFAAENFSELLLANFIVSAGPFCLIAFDTVIDIRRC